MDSVIAELVTNLKSFAQALDSVQGHDTLLPPSPANKPLATYPPAPPAAVNAEMDLRADIGSHASNIPVYSLVNGGKHSVLATLIRQKGFPEQAFTATSIPVQIKHVSTADAPVRLVLPQFEKWNECAIDFRQNLLKGSFARPVGDLGTLNTGDKEADALRNLIRRIRDSPLTFQERVQGDDIRAVLDDMSHFVRLLWLVNVDYESNYGLSIEVGHLPTLELHMPAFGALGIESFSLLDTPFPGEAKARNALEKFASKVSASPNGCIFCIPLNPTLDDMKYMGSFLTKFMKGKSIFVVVMTDGSTEQESAVVDLEKILKNYIGPDTQQNMRFYATPVHEIYHNLQLEDFLSANPDIPDGIELQTAIKDFLGDNLKSLEGLSPKVMSQRALIMKHTRERAECLTKVIRSLGDLIADSQQHAHRAAYEKLKTFHDSSSKKLNDWERAFKGSDTRATLLLRDLMNQNELITLALESVERRLSFSSHRSPPSPAPVLAPPESINFDTTHAPVEVATEMEPEPDCAEHTLSLFVDFARSRDSDQGKCVITLENYEEYLALLNKQIVAEELTVELEGVVSTLREAQGWLSTEARSSDNAKELYSSLSQKLRKIQPLNMRLLIESILPSIQAQIKDVGIVLLLGCTGTGKSTIIHYLAGSKMKKQLEEGSRATFFIAPEEIQDGLQNVTIGNRNKSETMGIKSLKITSAATGQDYVVCDSAGLFDTEGVERELANGAAIVEAIRSCRSVKLVFVLTSDQMGEKSRLSLLRTLFVSSVKRLLVDLPETVNKCYYLFNKYRDEIDFWTMRESVGKFDEKDLNATEKADLDFLAVIRDLKTALKGYDDFYDRKTKNLPVEERPRCRWLDMVGEDREEVLRDIDSLDVITPPAYAFRALVGENAAMALREQCTTHHMAIQKALNRREFALVRYKLHQLKLLSGALPSYEICASSFNIGIELISNRIGDLLRSLENDISRCLVNRQPNDELMTEFVQRLEEFFCLESIRFENSDVRAVDGDQSNRDQRYIVHSWIFNVLEKTKEQAIATINGAASHEHKAISDAKADVSLVVARLSQWCSLLAKLKSHRDESRSGDMGIDHINKLIVKSDILFAVVKTAAEQLLMNMREAVASSRTFFGPQQYAALFAVILDLDALQAFDLVIPGFKQELENALTMFQTLVLADWTRVVSIDGSLRHMPLTLQNTTNTLSSVFDVLSRNESNSVLPSELCKELYTSVSACIMGLCDASFVNSETFFTLRDRLWVIDQLRALPKIDTCIQQNYVALIESLRVTILRAKDDAMMKVSELNNDLSEGAIERLSVALIKLQQAAVFSDHSSRIYNNELQDVGMMIINQLPEVDTSRAVTFSDHVAIKLIYQSRNVYHSFLKAMQPVEDDNLTDLKQQWVSILEWLNQSMSNATSTALSCAAQFIISCPETDNDSFSDLEIRIRDTTCIEKFKYALQFIAWLLDSADRIGFSTNKGDLAKQLTDIEDTVAVMDRTLTESIDKVRIPSSTLSGAEADQLKARLEYLYIFNYVNPRVGDGNVSMYPQLDSLQVKASLSLSHNIIALEEFVEVINNDLPSISVAEKFSLLEKCRLLTPVDELLDNKKGFSAAKDVLEKALKQAANEFKDIVKAHDFSRVKTILASLGSSLDALEERTSYSDLLHDELLSEAKRLSDVTKHMVLGTTPIKSFDDMMEWARQLFEHIRNFSEYFTDDQSNAVNGTMSGMIKDLLANTTVALNSVESICATLNFSDAYGVLNAAKFVMEKFTDELVQTFSLDVQGQVKTTCEILEQQQSCFDQYLKHFSKVPGFYTTPLTLQQLQEHPPKKIIDSLPSGWQQNQKFKDAVDALIDGLSNYIISSLHSVESALEKQQSALTCSRDASRNNETYNEAAPVPLCRQHSWTDKNNNAEQKVNEDDEYTKVFNVNNLSEDEMYSLSTFEELKKLLDDIKAFETLIPEAVISRYQNLYNEVLTVITNIENEHKVKEDEMATKTLEVQLSNRLEIFYIMNERDNYTGIQDAARKATQCLQTSAEQFTNHVKSGKLQYVFTELPLHWNKWRCYSDELLKWGRFRKQEYYYYRVYRFQFVHQSNSYKPYLAIDYNVPNATIISLCECIGQQIRSNIQQLRDAETKQIKYWLNECEKIKNSLDEIDRFLQLRADGRVPLFFQDLLVFNPDLDYLSECGVKQLANFFLDMQTGLSDLMVEVKVILDEHKSVSLPRDESDRISRSLKNIQNDLAVMKESSTVLLTLKGIMYEGIRSYDDVNQEFMKFIDNFNRIVKTSYLHCEELKTVNSTDRDIFFKRVQMALSFLKEVDDNEARSLARTNERKFETECVEFINEEIDKIARAALEDELMMDVLRSMESCLEDSTIRARVREIKEKIAADNKLKLDLKKERCVLSTEELRSVLTNNNVEALIQVAGGLIDLKRSAQNTKISSTMDEINRMIDDVLSFYQNSPNGPTLISLLARELRNTDPSNSALAEKLINEHQAFKGIRIADRNKLYNKDASAILERMTGTKYTPRGPERERLFSNSVQYDNLYSEIRSNLLDETITETELSERLQDIITNCNTIARQAKISRAEKIRTLMAHIFAFWTIVESRTIYIERKSSNADDAEQYLLRPHAGQVLALFRIFGLDLESSESVDAGSKLFQVGKSMVQIGTGEGKSVTLAVTAMILVLLGYDVDIVCYSEYLSSRDRSSFAEIFSMFGISDRIKYGTFKDICEKFLNEKGDVRQGVLAAINGDKGYTMTMEDFTQSSRNASAAFRPHVLLIDEADVFFNSDFYGGLYTPYAKITGLDIEQFIRKIWTLRNSRIRLSSIKEWSEYKTLENGRFVRWQGFLEESTKMLLDDLKHFESVDYYVDKDPATKGRIGYKDHHGISYERTYRYKTLFAYFKERESADQNVDETRLRENIYLIVNCGSFSYAEVPFQYESVIGVTGTLDTLSKGQKTVLEDVYNIKSKTFMPSVYSDRQLKFDYAAHGPETMFKIFKRIDFHTQLRSEIDRRKKPEERPILVFFEDYTALNRFRYSEYMRDIRNEVLEMNENMSPEERTHKISAAMVPGTITLLTREFGRGIDFVTHDKNVDDIGGVHVIQTFLSLDVSEEVQIQGRTARQGKFGSYSMLLCEDDLEFLKLSETEWEQINSGGAGYDLIKDKRMVAFDEKYSNIQGFVKANDAMHKLSTLFLDYLRSGNFSEIQSFIAERNYSHVDVDSEVSYTLCLIDATGSMDNVIENTKTCISMTFERARAVIEQEDIAGLDFRVQIAVYRNYSEGPGPLLEYSPWANEHSDLETFISSIQTRGGCGNEAIEIGLWHANRVHKLLEEEGDRLNQVILIGDMPPNTPEEVTENRKTAGMDWSKTMYATETDAESEISKLMEKKIPVHGFYVFNGAWSTEPARRAFDIIATVTNPENPICQELDIEPGGAGANRLAEVITKSIFDSFNGRLDKATIKKMKNTYDEKFGFMK